MNPEDRMLSTSELLEKIEGRDAVLVVSASITEEICQLPKFNVKYLQTMALVIIILMCLLLRSMVFFVSNTPDVLTDAAADHTFALLIAITS